MISRHPRSFVVPFVSGAWIVGLTILGAGCLSMQGQSSLDSANPSTSTQPYVEAYFEYPGPQSQWSGPASFTLHVTAKDAGIVQIVMTPELTVGQPRAENHDVKHEGAIPHEAPTVSVRVPASSAHKTLETKPQGRPMTGDEAREQLATLATAVQGAGTPFAGCMSPVRVRLVRADGGLLEKHGCRSEAGWSRTVSDAVNVFVNAKVNGIAVKAERTVASTPVAPAAPSPEHASH
jgi:hypothetical protein